MRRSWVLVPLLAAALAACGGGGSGSETPTPESTLERPSSFAAMVAVEADDDPSLPGEYVDIPSIYGGYGAPDAEGLRVFPPHVEVDVDYVADGNSKPPAGGPHWGSAACGNEPDAAPPFCGPAPRGTYIDPWDAETLVHNMEHGGLVVWYNSSDGEVIDDLEDLIIERLENRQLLVMAPYPDMEEDHIAITGWSRIDKFPVEEYTRERVAEFIEAHERRFNPEDF